MVFDLQLGNGNKALEMVDELFSDQIVSIMLVDIIVKEMVS